MTMMSTARILERDPDSINGGCVWTGIGVAVSRLPGGRGVTLGVGVCVGRGVGVSVIVAVAVADGSGRWVRVGGKAVKVGLGDGMAVGSP